MSKIRSLISALLGLLALAALVVGLSWLLGAQGPLPRQQVLLTRQVSPLRTPTLTPFEYALPTTEPIAEYIGVTASSKDWPTLTPPPPLPPPPSPTPRITPTPPVPPKDIPPYDPRIPLRAEDIALAAVQPFDPGYSITFKAWSPDGERFLFASSYDRYILVQFENGAAANAFWDDLWIASTDGANPHKLADLANDWAWSPDGHSVAYLAPAKEQGVEGKLYVFDVEHLKSREIADCDLGGMDDLTWLPTDEITCRQNGVIHAIKSDGSEMRQLNKIFSSDPVAFSGETLPPTFQGNYRTSPDGRKIAYYKSDSAESFWIADWDGTNVVQIKKPLYVSADIVAWSPDSSRLAFSVPNSPDELGADLWVVNADGTGLRRVATPERDSIQFMDPAWSPDGKVIAFTHRVYSDTEYESVWVVNEDGTNSHLLVDVAFMPRWSPKGNEIAVLRERVIARLESLLVFVDLGQ